MKIPQWQYDECKHVGVNYADPRTAQAYDGHHQAFRNYEKDAKLIMGRLNLGKDNVVLDMGCGTGGFALCAAGVCRKVYAVDISGEMLNQLKRKAADAGIENIETYCAGFLSYKHSDEPVDAIVTVSALHHLPDFWKAVALRRMHDMLRPHGKLYLFDVVFSFAIDCYQNAIDEWVEDIGQKAGGEMAEETVVHVREEYSTFDWIMEQMLKRTGFEVGRRYDDFTNCICYVCQRD